MSGQLALVLEEETVVPTGPMKRERGFRRAAEDLRAGPAFHDAFYGTVAAVSGAVTHQRLERPRVLP